MQKQKWSRQYRESFKAGDAEDRIDLLFYRPVGFILAKVAQDFRISPSQVTILGMVAGVAAGICFAAPGARHFGTAALLFLLSGALDSADGQLARLAKNSTPFGLVLDGICDNVVFISVYVGCALSVLERVGWVIWPLALFAGLSHSLQSSLLDFYLREYLFFTGGQDADGYWNPSLAEIARALGQASSWKERWQWRLRYTWLFQQSLLSVRSLEFRERLRARRDGFPAYRWAYRQENRRLLHLWRPLGANVRTIAIMVFAYIERFELYLVLVDIIALNLLLSMASWSQFRSDIRLASKCGISPVVIPFNE